MYVPPWAILSGLGALNRLELCNLIANFEATTFLTMSVDKAADVISRVRSPSGTDDVRAFARRLQETAEKHYSSTASDRALRIRIWVRILEALDIDVTLSLSTRTAGQVCSAIAFKAASIAAKPPEEDKLPEQSRLSKLWKGVTAIGGRETRDFSSLVEEQAILVARSVEEAMQAGDLNDDTQSALAERIRIHIANLPDELRDEAMRAALSSGDKAAIGLLVSGTTAFSVGLGVNLAGFSAYILAAQASAFIPFMSGPAVVSTLFMIANPVFSIPAIAGLGYFANRYVNSGHATRLAGAVAIQLALRGLSSEREGLSTALNDFRNAAFQDFGDLPAGLRDQTLSRLTAIRNMVGGEVPSAPGDFPRSESAKGFGGLLDSFISRSRGDMIEVGAVTGLAAGEAIYNASSIDPLTMAAADFSRKQDIGDIFEFADFAGNIGAMSLAQEAGAGNHLRGYVAERIVAARLVESGHVVTIPTASNNAGFDLIVDGIPFQVKCLMTINGLKEHFAKYPDIPVYANSELAEAVLESGATWASKVYFIDGFEREIADLVMTTSLEAGEALGGLSIPYMAIAVSSARNLYQWWRGRIPISDLPLSVVMEGTVKGGLSAVGGLSGKAIGLLVFGPAGALVLGGIGGVGALVGAVWTRRQATRLLSASWLEELGPATENFRTALINALITKIDLLQEKRSQIAPMQEPFRSWLVHRFSDDILSLCEARHALIADIQGLDETAKARACLEIMTSASIHPAHVESEIARLFEVLRCEPSKTEAATTMAKSAWGTIRSRVNPG